MAYIKNIGGRAAGGGGAAGMFQRPGSLNNNVAEAESAASKLSKDPAARVKSLARQRELLAKDSLAMRARVQNLARNQEIKMGQDLAKQATSGKATHAGLGSSRVGYKKPTGLAAIPKNRK